MTLMSNKPSVCPISGRVHDPAIVSRAGGPSSSELNMCGICGENITLIRNVWIAITEEQADAIRKGDKQ